MTPETFLRTSYTGFHAVKNAADMLEEKGFVRLEENFGSLEPGGSYYLVHEGSALFAFTAGGEGGFAIAESHTDSPCLKLKGERPLEGEPLRLNVEPYGGGLLYSFLDRPLRIAGRLVTSDGRGNLKSALTASEFLVVIPSLAVHLNPEANQGFKINPQTDLAPLLSQGSGDFPAKLTDETVLDFDLFAVPDQAPFLAGTEGEFLCAPRLDNLTSVYATVSALTRCQPKGIALCALFDSEEIGSGTGRGAASRFFPRLLERIWRQAGRRGHFEEALGQSLVLSVDNGHAGHPAHPEKSDPANRVTLNGGVLIKRHPHYATDGLTAAAFKTILDRAGVPWQEFYSRSDVRCGSTIGLITGAQLGVRVCDVGLAQLAMHAAVETMGSRDVPRLEEGVRAFFDSGFASEGETFRVL